jgi:hypothetical protein
MLILDRINASIRGRRFDMSHGGPALDPHAWESGGRNVGSKRPEGWQPPEILVWGIRAGGHLRNAPEAARELLRQIRVETQ